MKKMLLLITLVLIAGVSAGCINYVNVDTLSYMEVSAEKEGHLITRAIYINSSNYIITRYKITQKKATKGNDFFLSLIQEHITDLDNAAEIDLGHLGEAIQYRSLETKRG